MGKSHLRGALSEFVALIAVGCLLATGEARAVESEPVILQNKYIQAAFSLTDDAWRLARIMREDGSDALEIDSDEFEILLFDGSRFTIDDYKVTGPVRQSAGEGLRTFEATYIRSDNSGGAPPRLTVTYALGQEPWLRKSIRIEMAEGKMIDRLQVARFSTPSKPSRGGEGQPVFIDDWFFGVDYPGFYSWHANDFVEPDFNYRHHYTIDFEGRDKESKARDGLVTLYHFPGYARQQEYGRWGIDGKTAVLGIARKQGDSAELALFDYIAATRKPPRSHLHFNNWYTHEAKAITVDSYVNETFKAFRDNLASYGARLDAMVPDHGWQNTKTYKRIFEPKLDDTHDPLPEIAKALREAGTGLGMWIALDGTNTGIEAGLKLGYREAYKEGFDRSQYKWMGGKSYFDMLDPNYLRDLKESIRYLIEEAGVDYFKHDFNHNFTTHYITQRHAREACLDTTLDILEYERELCPEVFQNYTNGTWFTPWWLQQANTLWMMSGDAGGNGAWPQVCQLKDATTYRDSWFFQSFNNPERCVRPIIPIANFMTHGILHSSKKSYMDEDDLLEDWSNYVVMYYARGTMLKELYINHERLNADQWKVLGMASAWAVANQERLVNTVLIGGDAGQGQVHGCVSWVDGRAIFSVRNPDRREQTLEVPFDRSVYYRGEFGRPYHARAIYPFVEEAPWRLTSGESFSVTVPGDSVVVYEIEPGAARSAKQALAKPLPSFEATTAPEGFALDLQIPDEEFPRNDLIVQSWALVDAELEINGHAAKPTRVREGRSWTLFVYDMRLYKGRKIRAEAKLTAMPEAGLTPQGGADVEVWLLADRKVDAPAVKQAPNLPFAISQNHRRLTQELIAKSEIIVASSSGRNLR